MMRSWPVGGATLISGAPLTNPPRLHASRPAHPSSSFEPRASGREERKPFCLLPAARRLPPASCCLLPAPCCLLPAACCLLPAACCLLPAACCLLPAACCRAAVLPIVRRAVIPVVAVIWGGVVTPVVRVDVGKLRPPEIGAPIGIAEPSLWPRFVDARNISFCCLSRHGQDCSRHHRENAEQGVAGLAHSPLHWIQSAVCGSRSPRSNEASRYPALRAASLTRVGRAFFL